MNALYYATRFVASGGKLPERAKEQPTVAIDCGDEVLDSEPVVGYEPTPMDDYEF